MLKTILIATLLALATSKTCKKCMEYDYTNLVPAMDEAARTANGLPEGVVDEDYKICSEPEDATCSADTDICVAGSVSLSLKGEAGGVAYALSGLGIKIKDCLAPELDCDDLYALMKEELAGYGDSEDMKIWIAGCSFDKCDSDDQNCEDVDDKIYEEPSSASAMTTMTVAIIALIKLF